MFFMYHVLKVEGSSWWDPAHRFHIDLRAALKSASLRYTILGTTVAFNLRQGPWQKASFFQGTVETMEKNLDNSSLDDGLFAALYQPLCQDLGMVGPRNGHCPAHG